MAYSIPAAQGVRRLATWKASWSGRPRHVQTVLAPALPALLLLAITTAGMIDPPQGGLVSQLHLTKTAVTCSVGATCSRLVITPR